MFFLLATPQYNNSPSNITKVKVHLRNGIAEIFDQHQDLMGKVENNLIEIESFSENKIEKSVFVLQDAVFIVSNQGLNTTPENKETTVYIYAKNAKEISGNTSFDAYVAEYEKKNGELAVETEKIAQENAAGKGQTLTPKLFLLTEEVEFLKKVVSISKNWK